MEALCLVPAPGKTAAEILEENAKSIATTKLVAKRFPDAVCKHGRWESPSVNHSNADGLTAAHRGLAPLGAMNGSTMTLCLYVTLRPKGCEPVRIHSSHNYRLTAEHLEAFLEDNSKLVFKSLASVLKCQETK